MNLPTIIVATIVALVFLAIVGHIIRRRKKGKTCCSCGSSCTGCSLCSEEKKQ